MTTTSGNLPIYFGNLLKGFLDYSWATCGMTGQELTECLRQLKPKLKVIISSRYSCNLINSKGHADPTCAFYQRLIRPMYWRGCCASYLAELENVDQNLLDGVRPLAISKRTLVTVFGGASKIGDCLLHAS
jgi:hypothetical protein